MGMPSGVGPRKPNRSASLDLSALVPQATLENGVGFLVLRAGDAVSGAAAAQHLLETVSGSTTLLCLSGGRTPADLYSSLARDGRLKAGAGALVDERFGEPLHAASNHLMVLRTGLLDFFERQRIPFYPILTGSGSLEQTAGQYGTTLSDLFSRYPSRVGILGMGADGHIAGIAPSRPDFRSPLFSPEQSRLLVACYTDPVAMSPEGESFPPFGFGQRITMTIKALSELTIMVLLVFGSSKRAALKGLMREGPVESLPARFLRRPEVARKTLIITDQKE